MKAIFTGTIEGGFSISAITNVDAVAEDIVIKHLANGQLAEAIEVYSPSTLVKNYNNCDSGLNFISYGTGFSSGIMLVGPFQEYDVATEFAEQERDSDEWEIFTITSEMILSDSYIELMVTMRSRATGGEDKMPVQVWNGKSGNQAAMGMATSYGAYVTEIANIDGTPFIEIETLNQLT